MEYQTSRLFHVAKRLLHRIPVSRFKRQFVDAALSQIEELAYSRLRDKGFAPNGIIDVGAHQGDWIRAVRRVFREAPILALEAREEQRETLSRVCAEIPGVQFRIALLGSEAKSAVRFQVHGSGSSLFLERSDAHRTVREMQMRTLDELVSADSRLNAPMFLKLDVQGAELEVLQGAEQTLARSEIVQLEVALLNYNEGAPLAGEVIEFMGSKGFMIFDIVGFVRPNGVDLAQIDLLFVKNTSRLRRDYFHFESSGGKPPT